MTMNEQQIGEALLEITNALTEKLGRHPSLGPYLSVDDTGKCSIGIYADRTNHYKCTARVPGDTFAEAIDAAWSVINAIPSQEEHARAKFTQAVGAAIEAGNEAGIDLDFINPLKEMMTSLSENAITYKDC